MENISTPVDGAAPRPASSLPMGWRLHEYEIKSVLGEGGFGIVYLARDTLLGRDVAIKEFLPVSHATRYETHRVRARTQEHQVLFDKGMQSFVAEARILAQFRNRNLVEVLRFWEGNGTAYLVMPYYQGRTLRELIQKGYRSTTKGELLSILLPLMQGLDQVHEVGCYHRDISPDNIMILSDGSPLLLDFGAARHEIISQADYSTVILKPGFAPIEQYGGSETAAQQGSWTDVYALCAVAYQMITGNTPPVSVARIMRDPLVPLRDLAGQLQLPVHVLEAIDAGLKIQPQDRPQSMKDLRRLFESGEIEIQKLSESHRIQQQVLKSDAAHNENSPSVNVQVGALSIPEEESVQPDFVSTDTQRARSSKKFFGVVLAFLLLLGVGAGVFLGLHLDAERQTVLVHKPKVEMDSTAQVAASETDTLPVEPQQHEHVNDTEGIDASRNGGGADAEQTIGTIPTDLTAARSSEISEGAELSQRAEEDVVVGTVEAAASQLVAEEPSSVVEGQQAEEAAVSQQGRIIVDARPWGDVYINDVLIGTTPPRVSASFPPGLVRLEIRNDGVPSHKRTLELQAGQTTHVSHNFLKQPALPASGTEP